MNLRSVESQTLNYKEVFVVELDWAYCGECGNEIFIFDDIEAAINEYNAQLNHIKTNDSNWEFEALNEAFDENGDEPDDVFNDEPIYYFGEYDYTNCLRNKAFSTIKFGQLDLLKSFVLYCNGDYNIEHTNLTVSRQLMSVKVV